MAGPLICELCNEREGAYIIGNMKTGAQTIVCDEDWPQFCLVIALEGLPLDYVRDQAVNLKEQAAAAAREAAPDGSSPKRKGRKVAKPVPGKRPAKGVAEASPAPADG